MDVAIVVCDDEPMGVPLSDWDVVVVVGPSGVLTVMEDSGRDVWLGVVAVGIEEGGGVDVGET